MHIRTRVLAATAAATAALVGPAALATSSSTASAAPGTTCVHLYIASASQGPLLDIHVIVIPPLSIGPGPCPK